MRKHPKNPNVSNPLAARILIFITRHRIPILSRLYMYALGCDIGLRLPKSVFLPHPLGIIIRADSNIGDNVIIAQQVTIGAREFRAGAPVIDEGTFIGAGAKVLGPVYIGRGACIGANAVVTKDVPPGKTVVGANRLISAKSVYALD